MAGSSASAGRGNQLRHSSPRARARARSLLAWPTRPPSRKSTIGMETRGRVAALIAAMLTTIYRHEPHLRHRRLQAATGCRGDIGFDHWPVARHSLQCSRVCDLSARRGRVIRVAARVLGIVALATLATPVLGEDDFPLVGTYTENQACKGDGSDSGVSRVKITVRDIDSVFGLCTILSRKREGATFAVHVECKGPGGSQMLGDVNFTPRDDKIIDFSDQDQTYKATLYKCPE